MGSKGEASDQDMLSPDLLPPSTPDFSGKVGLNFALNQAWLLPVAVVRLHDGDLHAVGWVEDQ